MSSNIRIEKVCNHCGVVFIAKTTVTKYCSDKCAKRAYKARKRTEKLQQVPNVDRQQATYNKNNISDKHFLSISEVCSLLGASRMTLYRQIKKGNITVAKLGGRTIIKRSEIDKLFTS